ncbi:MAG TPA: hypothetical protein VIE65_02895 [Methylobacter sp.]
MKRRVFEELYDKVPRFKIESDTDDWHREFFAASIHPEREILLSEDYHFCDLWRRHGAQVFVAPWLKLAHIGGVNHAVIAANYGFITLVPHSSEWIQV